ncbi:hypothetical protein GCK72_002218 [Caenorhabditis remanei]|uniref:RING-type domain-containing protein n=2 Tax=Caenorhabditis remanei TaxID=31234 RepID=E3MGD0_CAERE|nr:hypothetical protein GCK72_002218 [Caenorhabditis remanei]EFP01505.1 hypothetical protein CRE_23993 [Caenorhabditis remanei]KAF1770400.1 hypothetical protein GCK72_002218 [Caenorhabditis remanei]
MTTRLDFTTADLITCLICIREFDTKTRKPKVLHCGHTVCEECSENLKDANSPSLSVRCPTCRQFTQRMQSQTCNTNFQLMGYLAEKEKMERERTAKGEKVKKTDQHFQFRVGRSNKMEIHIASKKDLNGTEMYMRKDVDGATHLVLAGKTGSPEEIIKFINDNGICIETGKLTPQIVHDEGRTKEAEKFAKVNSMATGQSAMKCAKPPAKLEELEFQGSFELKATEVNGSIKLELIQKGDVPKNGFGVLGGCMTKPTTKRIKELTAACEPSTSSKADVSEAPQEPLPKRRRGRK